MAVIARAPKMDDAWLYGVKLRIKEYRANAKFASY